MLLLVVLVPVEHCSIYQVLVLIGLRYNRDLLVKTASWIFLLCSKFRNLSFLKDSVAESYFLAPVMDLMAKF